MTIIYHSKPIDPPPPYSQSQDVDVPREEETNRNRETIIKHTSQSITGSYDLLDLLDLSTSSGSIDVTVTPQEAKRSHDAMFKALTSSGRIRANFPKGSTGSAHRNLKTLVDTSSGSVLGSFTLGSSTTLESLSGKIDVLVSAPTGIGRSALFTGGASGIQMIDIISESGERLNDVHIRSGSTSGNILIRVPFEGRISAQSTSGKVTVEGKGVTIEKDVQGVLRLVEARAGKGNGTIHASTVSGSIRIIIE
ncbi:hypothetical protein P7C71_g5003, partial [Lecanoromycetidae sp. Uapishka_2]